jgi:iron complex outermembrane receptor protein
MVNRKSKIQSWIVGAACVVGFAATDAVIAADDEVLEEIVVTGSRIKRSDESSISPMSIFSTEDIQAAGTPTIEDFLQNMSTVTGGDFGSTVNNGNPGYATASLRGLGAGRTLVLVNGRRPASASTTGRADLNDIPVSLIERIEVLRDGASTVYGTDAIAGVINFITKRDFEGVQFDYDYQTTSESDGDTYRAALTIGGNFDRGNAVFNIEYMDRGDIWQGDRSFSRCPLSENDSGTFCSGSGTTYPGHIFPSLSSGHHIVDPADGMLRPFNNGSPTNNGGDTYNYALASYMVTPMTTYSMNGSARYTVVETDSVGSIDTFMEANFSNRQSDQLMAAVGTFWAPEVGVTHPNNPFSPGGGSNPCGDDQNFLDNGCDESVFVARRLFETGGRNFTQDAETYRIVFGFEGELANNWAWDISYNYAHWQDTRYIKGQINQPRVDVALDPAACAADADCPKVWNLFARDTLDQELQDYILVNHSPVAKSETKTFQINLTGDSGGFELPGGPIGWAVGFENRKEEASFLPDGAAKLGQIYFVAGDETRGEFEVDEFYAEVQLPILTGAAFAEILALEASVRSSDYDTAVGTTTNTKFAIEWAPISDVRFRAVYSEGFRAPSIGELYAPEQLSAQQYNEPCLDWGLSTNAIIRANCAADGLPEDFNLTSTQGTMNIGGYDQLEAEESESTTFGIVITPEALPDLVATIDYFDIEITDAVGIAGTDNVVTGCYNSENFSSPLCALIEGPAAVGASPHHTSPRRDALATVTGARLTNANLATFNTTGIDFNVDYSWDLDMGQLAVNLNGTFLEEYSYTLFAGAPEVTLEGKFGEDQWFGSPAAYPEWKTSIGATFTRGDWQVGGTARYMSEVDDVFADPGNLENTADAIWYVDVNGVYEWNQWTFSGGVRNLFDEDPPYVTNNDDMNTIMMTYDTAGRYFYARVGFAM